MATASTGTSVVGGEVGKRRPSRRVTGILYMEGDLAKDTGKRSYMTGVNDVKDTGNVFLGLVTGISSNTACRTARNTIEGRGREDDGREQG